MSWPQHWQMLNFSWESGSKWVNHVFIAFLHDPHFSITFAQWVCVAPGALYLGRIGGTRSDCTKSLILLRSLRQESRGNESQNAFGIHSLWDCEKQCQNIFHFSAKDSERRESCLLHARGQELETRIQHIRRWQYPLNLEKRKGLNVVKICLTQDRERLIDASQDS